MGGGGGGLGEVSNVFFNCLVKLTKNPNLCFGGKGGGWRREEGGGDG